MFRAAVAGLLIPAAAVECEQVQLGDRVDCTRMDEDSCRAAGCCWGPVSPNPGNAPWCFFSNRTLQSCTLGGDAKEPFSDEEAAEVLRLFEANLDAEGSGEVMASPDHATGPGGDYYYAWARDGALSMHAYLQTKGAGAEEKMGKWLSWVERSMNQPDPNDVDILVEPKYLIPQGTPYTGGWCRPQNDGPGLRAVTAMAFAAQKPEVAGKVWELVRRNLDWVAANHSSETCDLWEEVRSSDFFWNRYTMRKALILGSKFAASAGKDEARAAKYSTAAKEIEQQLGDHVDASGYVFESTDRRKDTAVIEAFNVGDLEDGLFGPLSTPVVRTLATLSDLFCKSYAVNQQAAAAKTPGVLFGRYEGDSYDGGNPWVLLTASAATLLYRQAQALAKGGSMDADANQVLHQLLGRDVTQQNLLGAGDALLLLMKKYLTNGMHMNEQIDRNDGSLKSAKDLTWNYANVLKAIAARKAAAATETLVI
ncbi:unnamed protein product [Effrenium voratum]|uniref:glucan 1,4-alpha-glucosidase n=2 Tax=Effrenium voratum TaxID=2562239 RepID=A0AA36HV91_9DINO|nr:unnamed protein product [Effrenium voratum]